MAASSLSRPILLCLLLLLVVPATMSFLMVPGRPVQPRRTQEMKLLSSLETEPSIKKAEVVDSSAADTKESKAKQEPPAAAGPCPGFPKCDGAYRNKGCVDGKISGGVGAMPGMGWWPIKAYRPCPSASDAGYGYKRRGPDFGEFLAGERRSVTEEKEASRKQKKGQ